MKDLLITTGHNSSAILIEDGRIVWGYETERVTGVKSDSRFAGPVLDHTLCPKPDMVYVSHWAPSGRLNDMGRKYWQPDRFDGLPCRTLSPDCTHHDAHMAGAVCYAGPHFPFEGTYGVVIDGFGVYGEHLSIYDLTKPRPRLIRRVHGYNTSLGLWYQYATAFMGMKMHEDEYKLLGYEVHVSAADREFLDRLAQIKATKFLDEMDKSIYGSKYDPVYDLNALVNVKTEVFRDLTQVCKDLETADPSSYEGRVQLSYYVQAVLEQVVLRLVNGLNARNVILSGGVFYNVKLNKRILDDIEGYICVYPLAGDQGNAIGLYSMDHPDFVFPRDLNWGERSLRSLGDVQNMHVVDEPTAKSLVRDLLRKHGFVNLVRGAMEFGPRAMCNTSTLAVPTTDNVQTINAMNDRNTVMPMAPVMTQAMYYDLFEKPKQVWRSHHHMIVAMEYTYFPDDDMLGVAHEYNYPYHHHTGRPQVVDNDTFMVDLLRDRGKPLINTSFNFHGTPIALGMESIISNHMMQIRRCPNIHTVVIRNDQ